MPTSLLAIAALGGAASASATDERPNVVLILTDDQGYADLGCYGAEDIATPHLDRLATEGARFTDFHVSQGVCTASRASLMTGCYAERVGLRGALGPSSRVGLDPAEETLAELLRARGYATGIVGKWHLGHHPEFLPTRQGFDSYHGLPYSNDMWPVDYDGTPLEPGDAKWGRYPSLWLYEDGEPTQEVRTLADQAGLTERYTQRALGFIDEHAEEPFFLYLAHSLPHVPLGEPLRRAGDSERGPYGDVIEEIDASTGRILAALDRHGLRESTIVVFTSDNGPWLSYGDHAGSAGPLREGKLTAWEGGQRVPCLVRWPGHVPAGRVVDSLAANIDLLPTIVGWTGARLPERPIDGVDLAPLLAETHGAPPRRTLFHYYGGELRGVRRDGFKLVFPHGFQSYAGKEPGTGGFPGATTGGRTELALFDLAADVGETLDVAGEHPDVVRELEALAEEMRAELGDRLRKVRGSAVRGPGRLSPLRETPIDHLGAGATVRLSRPPSPQYEADGAPTLADGDLGSEDFSDGEWLGFRGGELEVTLDLGEARDARRVACSFLRSQSSWIFLPRSVELAVSSDGETYDVVAELKSTSRPNAKQEARTFEAAVGREAVRFVRVRAVSVGDCPEWHAGAGELAWLFVDEVVVE